MSAEIRDLFSRGVVTPFPQGDALMQSHLPTIQGALKTAGWRIVLLAYQNLGLVENGQVFGRIFHTDDAGWMLAAPAARARQVQALLEGCIAQDVPA